MEETGKIGLVCEFANVDVATAETCLRACNWSVDDAVNRALSAPIRPAEEQPLLQGSEEVLSWVGRMWLWLRKCFGWLFPRKQSFADRARQKYPEIAVEDLFLDGPLRTTLTRQPPSVAVLALYADTSRDAVIDAVVGNFRNTNFRVHAFSVDTSGGFELARTLRVRSVPLFLGVVTGNFQEICRAEISSLPTLLASVRQADANLRDERNKIAVDRDIRAEQDREYARLVEETQSRKTREETADKRVRDIREAALVRVRKVESEIAEISDHLCRISVKLQDGTRVEKRFPQTAAVSLVYDWLVSASLLDEYQQVGSLHKLTPGQFYLSTTFPSRKLNAESVESFETLGLTPNALLVLTIDQDDS